MTTSPITDQQLDDIEQRTNAATPGPWGAYEFGGGNLIEIAAELHETGTGYRARREICRLEDEPLDNDPAHREWTAEEDWAQVQADAEFIAHAPEDVRALVAEVRRLRKQRDFLVGQIAKKDAASGEGDKALREFLAAEEPFTAGELAVAQADVDHLNAEFPDEPADGAQSEACGKCKTPFDPADTRFDGRARFYLTPYCRGCVDRCHDSEIADHRCVICA